MYVCEKILSPGVCLPQPRGYIHVYFHNYTPGIYADGYIVFAFPFVRSYVRWFVHLLVRSLFRNVRGIYVEVFVKVSLVVYIS